MLETDELHAGRTLGSYELLVPLARGATASVWAARTTGSALEKVVAVKAMLTDFVDELDAESMFLDEARLISRIRHPNVVAVLDFGEAGEALYIVMEFIDGEPLQVLMKEARTRGIPLPLAVRIATQAASGLHASHEVCDERGKPVNLVHRDVSPQNLLITYDGTVKVIDFGVAKAASNLQKTSVGQLKGKVAYMAPEQAVGDRVDRRTDVFALGLVLFMLLTGKHPFRADNEYATLARIRDKTPAPSMRSMNPAISPDLDAVVLKALAKDPAERFATMLDFARALERAVPPSPDVDRELGAFVGSLLLERKSKRQQAIRDAKRELDAGKGQPSPKLREAKPLYEPETTANEATPLAASFSQAVASAIAAEIQPAGAPLFTPAPAPPTPPPAAAPQAAPAPVFEPVSTADPGIPEGLRPKRNMKLIAAGIALLFAVVIAVWAASSGSSSDAPPGAPTKRAF
jgi:serine/threonine-protein kinase